MAHVFGQTFSHRLCDALGIDWRRRHIKGIVIECRVDGVVKVHIEECMGQSAEEPILAAARQLVAGVDGPPPEIRTAERVTVRPLGAVEAIERVLGLAANVEAACAADAKAAERERADDWDDIAVPQDEDEDDSDSDSPAIVKGP